MATIDRDVTLVNPLGTLNRDVDKNRSLNRETLQLKLSIKKKKCLELQKTLAVLQNEIIELESMVGDTHHGKENVNRHATKEKKKISLSEPLTDLSFSTAKSNLLTAKSRLSKLNTKSLSNLKNPFQSMKITINNEYIALNTIKQTNAIKEIFNGDKKSKLTDLFNDQLANSSFEFDNCFKNTENDSFNESDFNDTQVIEVRDTIELFD